MSEIVGKGTFSIELNGELIHEGENDVVSNGVNHVLEYRTNHEGTVTTPWPLDEDGNPLPIELDLNDVPGLLSGD